MNEFCEEDKNVIDVREIIAILNMFNQNLYPIFEGGSLTDQHPIQSYSGKEASLRRFLNQGEVKRNVILNNMNPIIKDIFKLWDLIETTFADMGKELGKRYGTRKYSKYDNGNFIQDKSTFEEKRLRYYVPRGIMYPIIGAFRALITTKDGIYSWKKNPIQVWNEIGGRLAGIMLDEKNENTELLAKNSNLWSNLFKEVYINGYLNI